MNDINTKDLGVYADHLQPFRYENYHHFTDDDKIAFTMDDGLQYPIICCDCGLVHWFRFKKIKKNDVIFHVERAEEATKITRKMPPIKMEMIDKIKQLEQDKQKLLDHAKWLHDCLDEMPCELCEEMELAKQAREK